MAAPRHFHTHPGLARNGPGLPARDLPPPAVPAAAAPGVARSPRPSRPRGPPATPSLSSAPGSRRPGIVHSDGFAWVKYGEKKLTPSRLVREYYKCKNWREPGAGGTGCRARKIVDRSNEEGFPPAEQGKGAGAGEQGLLSPAAEGGGGSSGAADTEGESRRGGRKILRAVFPRHCPSQSPEYSQHNHEAPAPATPQTPSPDVAAAAAAAAAKPWASLPCGGLPPLPTGSSLPGPCTQAPHSAAAAVAPDVLGLEGCRCHRGPARGGALPSPHPDSLVLQQALDLLSQGWPRSMEPNPCPRTGLEASEASQGSGSHSTLLQASSAGLLAGPSVPRPLRAHSGSPNCTPQQGLSPRPTEQHVLLGASAPAPKLRSREGAWKRPALTPLVIPEDPPEESRQAHSWCAGARTPSTDLGGLSQAATPALWAQVDMRRRENAAAAGLRSSALSLALILAQQQHGETASLLWPEPCNNSPLLPLPHQQDSYPGSCKRIRHASVKSTPAPCVTAQEGGGLLPGLSAASPAPFLQPRTASGDCSCETMDSAAKVGTALPGSAPALLDVPCKGWAEAAICATPSTGQAVVKQESLGIKRERGTLELGDIPDDVLLSLLHAVTDQILTSTKI